jgi:hypothetical protein
MEKYNMKKIITLLMLMFIVSISFAQYTPMTAAGYQFKRILCDSTLHIPSFCGIPTLRNSTAKNGAIAMDTCNYKIYMWTNAVGWGEIIGAGTDTTSLSLRIDQRVKYTDTAAMLLAYLRKQDTANKWVANVTRVNDTTIRVFKGNTITDLKILGKQVDTTSLSNRIDQKLGKADSTIYYTKYRSDTSRTNIYNAINTKLSKSDSTIFYTKYRSDTSRTNIYNAINQKLNITDTTNKWVNNVTKVNDSTIRVWKGSTSTTIELPRGSGGGGGTGTVYNVSTGYALSGGPINTTGTIIVDSSVLSTKYLRRADTSNLVATKSNLALKLNIADTATMLSKYLRKVDTLSLSNRINLKLNIADTSNKWVNAVTKKNDSTITVFKGATATDITLPRGSSGSTGTVTNVATGYGLSGGPITSTGTIIVDSATLSSKYLRRADTSNLVATKSNLALKLNIADTTNKWVNAVTSINDSTVRVFKGTTSTDLKILGKPIDTANKFVNAVTKINDTAIRVWKGTTSSVISFAKDIVYTQSPIMRKVSNDSNIIYFNADTANAWRGGGSGTIPPLQDVITAGNTYTLFGAEDTFKLFYDSYDTQSKLHIFNLSYPQSLPGIDYQSDLYVGSAHSELKYGNFGNAEPNNVVLRDDGLSMVNGIGGVTDSIKLDVTGLKIMENNGYGATLNFNNINPANPYDVHMPFQYFTTNDTLATLRDLRNGGGGGGTGTVTNVATGYGLSGGPITNTGTLLVDSATLSSKYLRIVDTTNKWINGSGIATRVPYWSANRTLTSSANMIWNISDSSLGVSNFYTGTAGSTQFDINSTATSLPVSLGIWRRQINGAYTYFKEDEQGNAQHKWAFVRRDGFNQTRAFYQANSSIMNINLGWESPNSSNYDGSTLLINPKINISNALHSGTIIRGIYYNPTLTSLTNTKHIAFQSTSGDIIFNNLKTSTSTSDSIAIFVNDTLKKAPYPSGGGGSYVPYTGATSNLDMGTKNVTANAYFNGFTSMVAAGTTVTLTVDSTPVHLVSGSGGQTFQLPNATTLSNGTIFSFNNNQSSGNISVNNNSTTLVKSVPSGAYLTLELINNTNAAGTWDAHFQTPSNVSWSTNTLDWTGSITNATWNGATVAYNRGGTGQSSLFTQGGVAFGSTTTALGTTAAGTAGQMLVSAGTGTPTWADTSVFQRKSISSYTMLANNTNATGNATAQTFRDTAGTYAGTITWTGTAPTTQTINAYQWQQTGKMVRLQLFGYYTNAGVAATSVSLTIPADCPAPDISMFTSGALAVLYQGIGGLGLSNTSLTTTTNAYMRRNAANNGNELLITAAGANYRRYQIDITYRAQ